MKFKESTVTTQKEILKRRLGGELFEEITLDSTAFANNVCKAGNPIEKAFACVNEANANANAGITIAAAVKTALPLIVFE